MLEHLRRDLTDAVRELRRRPGIVAGVIVTLGASVGMNLAMVSLVDRALLSPPAHIVQADAVFGISFQAPGEPAGRAGMTTTSYVTYRTVRDEVPALAGAAAWRPGPISVVIDGEQVAADTRLVSGNYFELLGARPSIGPGIAAADETSASTSAVLSHEFWLSAFRGDHRILERRLTIGGIDYQIAGVMPSGFSGHSPTTVDVWVPISTAMRNEPGWDKEPFRNIVSVVGRIAPGGNRVAATEQITAALERVVELTPLAGSGVDTTTRRIAFWLTGVSGLIVVIGFANVATLLLVRAAQRRRSSAIRTALGATRGRLISQIVVEASLIAAGSVVASILFGYWLEEIVRRVLLPSVSGTVAVQPRVLFAAAASGVIAILVSTAAGASSLPVTARTADLNEQGGPRRLRLQKSLLVVQTSVCVMLLAGAGMFSSSLLRLMNQDFGIDTGRVLLVDFEEGSAPLPEQDEFFNAALQRVRSLPGVEAATTYQTLPFGGHHIPPISVPGRADPPNVGGQLPFLIGATPEMFDILGVRITDGRAFSPQDQRDRLVVIVNETMARETWPGERAVGKCIRIGFDPSFDPLTDTGPPTPSSAVPCREVIGVARDVRQRRVVPTENEARLMQYCVPPSQVPPPPGGIAPGPRVRGLLVRGASDPTALAGPIRKLVLQEKTDLPFLRVRAYSSLLERQLGPWMLGWQLLAIFSVLALAVAAMGLFAAFAHAVTVRRREMAIRVAIGATRAGVVRLILREAAALAAAGIVVGALAAVAGGRSLQTLLFGIVPADPAVLGAAAAAMSVVALAATIIPARRASQSDPGSLLKQD